MESMRNLVAEEGPEILGDFCGPLAKWILRLFNRLIANHPDANRFIAYVFGSALHHKQLRSSPLQIFALAYFPVNPFDDVNAVATMQSSALSVFRLTLVILLMVVGQLEWKWVLAVHVGILGYNLCQINQQDALAFQAALAFLYIGDTTATTTAFSSRFLVHLLGSLIVFVLKANFTQSLTLDMCYVCCFLICFCTPLWFGVCVYITFAMHFSVNNLEELAIACTFSFVHLCISHFLVYLSAGGFWGFCGSLFLSVVLPFLKHCDDKTVADLMAPLPLVCALLSCFFVPLWVGVCVTSMIVCNFALANNNMKAILWWAVSFCALHALSYAFSGDLSVPFICLLGMYFSYGCIL